MSYAERMLAEQLAAAEVREYEMQFAEEQQVQEPGFFRGLTHSVSGTTQSVIGLTSAILMVLLFLAMCVISFVGGWLFGDELFFFLGNLFEIATGG